MKENITVIGTIFMDCKGFADEHYHPQGRNVGEIAFVHGGVGRNIAENLARIGAPVRFIAAHDSSPMSKAAVDRLRQAGVDVGAMILNEEKGVGLWLAILGADGDLLGSVSQMPDLTLLEQAAVRHGGHWANISSHIALELDLNLTITRKVLEYARAAGKPVYGIPGNLEIIRKDPGILSDTALFICNHIEAGRLWNCDFSGKSTEEMAVSLPRIAKERRLNSLVVTLGERGSVYYDSHNGETGYQPVFQVQVTDTTGAGDAFFSGTVAALANGNTLREAIRCGSKVAAWTIESSENTNPGLQNLAREDAWFKLHMASPSR